MAARTYNIKVPDAPEKLVLSQDLTGTDTLQIDYTDWVKSGKNITAFSAAITANSGTAPTLGSQTLDAAGLVGTFTMTTSGATAGTSTLTITGTSSNGEVKTCVATVIVA